jgi:hypothetical protein
MRNRLFALMFIIPFAAALFTGEPSLAANPAVTAAKTCRGQITSRGKSYAKARRGLLLSCFGKLLKCSLLEEIDHLNVKTCRDSATASCIAKLNTVSKGLLLAQQKFVEKITLGCAVMTADNVCSTAAGGLWFDNDAVCGSSNAAACGAAVKDLPTIVSCIRGEIEPEVDENVGRVAPRAGMLLDNIGLGALFPDLPRPPTTTVTVTATASESGVLNNPGGGTIALPAGRSLTIIGDETTLPCGTMTTNGSLTIKVGSGTACANSMVVDQEVTIKEPYGASRAVLLGPYNDDRVYCITLKDKQGMSGCTMPQGYDVSGTVDVDVPTPQPTPATSSSVIRSCHSKLQGKVKTLSGFTASKLHGCGDKVAKCELAKEIDSPAACTASYAKPCNAMTSAIETKLTVVKVNVTTTGKCPIIPFAHLLSFSGGLGFSNSNAACSGAASLGPLADCIYGVADTSGGTKCSIERKSFIRDPRIVDSMMNKAGLTPATDFPCLGP